MIYGTAPWRLGKIAVDCTELMFFHDLPIKLPGQAVLKMEERLTPFVSIVNAACRDFIFVRGMDAYMAGHVYICAKRLYQAPGSPFNRPGWHTDGFGTEDINYVWSDNTPTVFNVTPMELSNDDVLSMTEMRQQALPENNRTYPDGTLLRLDQYVVHRVGHIAAPSIRTFCKVTFSTARFDLAGNSRNPLLDYDWPIRERSIDRNVPGVVK